MAELTKDQVIEYLSGMTVMDLTNLISTLEEKWGVSAAAPVAAVAAGPVAAEEDVEEQTEFDVVVTGVQDGKRISVIKTIKGLLGLGLKEAKEVADSLPKAVKEGVGKDEAEELKKQLEEAGAVVEVK